jgi:hypothetical protein
MKLILFTFCALAAIAQQAAEPKPEPRPEPKPAANASPAPAAGTRVTRVFEFVPDDAEQMQKLSQLVAASLARIHLEPALGLVAMTGSEEAVTEAERLLKQYYKSKPMQPGTSGIANRNVELVTQILYARTEGNENSYPASLQPVVQQLKQVTRLNSFSVVETQVARVRIGSEFNVSGTVQWPGNPESVPQTYQYKGLLKIAGAKIQIDQLRFGSRVPFRVGESQYQFMEVGLNTFVDLQPGQATVVGKTNASTKDGSIILVLTARLVD